MLMKVIFMTLLKLIINQCISKLFVRIFGEVIF